MAGLVAARRALLLLGSACFACQRPDGGDVPALLFAAAPGAAENAARLPTAAVSGSRPGDQSRLYARSARTWIYSAASIRAGRLGYMRAGAAVATRRTEGAATAGTDGCAGGWYPIEPRGFVCAGTSATLDPADSIVQLTREGGPNFQRKLPYIYGTVRRPGPVYDRLPTAEHLKDSEPDLAKRMDSWLAMAGEAGAGYAQQVWLGHAGEAPDPALYWKEQRTEAVPELLAKGEPVPIFADAAKREGDPVVSRMRPRAGYSFLRTFHWQGRRYGLTVDLTLAPTDRFRPIQGSDFRGVEIGKEFVFPFAFVRHPDAHFYQYQGSNDSLVEAGVAAYRSAVLLTGKQSFFHGKLHYETRDGKWLSDRHASRIDPAKRMPAWGKNGERWLDINLTKQTLVAYDGTRPVYATLISSGEAGLEDPEHTTATKRGIFRIHTKHVSTTMSSNEAGEAFELRDVPYVQYFDEGYALHGAYWHDRFGTPKSHGCINLSPEDARRLFFFTEPALPDGWHGVLLPLRGTVVFVHP